MLGVDIRVLPLAKLVNVWAMASYAYYERDISLISDSDYDWICKTLLGNLDQIDHQHSYLLDDESLKAGTAYHIKDWPGMVIGGAEMWIEDYLRKTGVNGTAEVPSKPDKLKKRTLSKRKSERKRLFKR